MKLTQSSWISQPEIQEAPDPTAVGPGSHSNLLLVTSGIQADDAASIGVFTLTPVTPSTTLCEAAELYLHSLETHNRKKSSRGLNESTIRNRRLGLSRLGKLGAVPLGKLRRSQVLAWLEEIALTPTPSLEYICLRALQALVRWCADQDAISIGLVSKIPCGYESPPGRALSWDELNALRQHLASYDELLCDAPRGDVQILRTLADNGARPHEIVKARDEHFDRHAGVIRWPRGKNKKPRIVVLSPASIAIIKSRWRRSPSGLLFPSHKKPNAPFCNQWLNDLLRTMAQEVGIDDAAGLTLYDFRHTFATLSYERGCSIEEVASALSHLSTKTTRTFYLHNAVHPGARRCNAVINPEEAGKS